MSIKSLCVLIFVGYACSTYAQSQTKYSDSVEEKIKQVENNISGWVQIEGVKSIWTLPERMKYYHVNGLSIAVIHNYKLEWAKGYGWADSAMQIPVTTQTLFQAASISKSLNAVGVLKLAQEKKLNIYNDINNYLKSWQLPESKFTADKKVTVYNLLNHTAGLNVHGFLGYKKGDSIPSIVQILNGEKPANSEAIRSYAVPGTKVEYSGGGVLISQLIVMDITHEPYDKYQWDEVLKPLGMTHSFYTQPPPKNKSALLATGYDTNGKEINGKYHIYPELAPAGLWTNPVDLSKFIIETQLSYEGKSNKVLSQTMTKEMLTPFKGSDAGLGVFIDSIGNRTYFQHGGSNEGFKSQYFASLTGGDGVVVMVNSDQDGILRDVINSIAHAYNWKDFYKPQKRKAINVPDDTLERYVGNYSLNQINISVFKKGNNLFLSRNGGAPMQLFFTSNTDFVLMEIQANNIKFEKNKTGDNYDIVLKAGDNDVRFVKK
ncbi:MAG TPA: serine hydrolase domain-containing protein [Hanamia sp.]|nr:serine hydrolase domain-containing protein [Hanamia sp.]